MSFSSVLVLFCFWLPVINAYSEGTKQLLFVQALWRHGDRSPTKTWKTDGFQESSWTFGGGGWGQLSPKGMTQHFKLGKLLRSRYIESMKFLPPVYDSKKIYIRSTDVNRTIISAMSNMLGMYGQDNYGATAGKDYPDIDGWPRGFIPIATHTVDDDTDHVRIEPKTCFPQHKSPIHYTKLQNEKR
ncbi:unnamed protein product [Caenorhabditis auriculariae]|uniref:Uncharacterized protein n=1 Tax=Caenorhabditis auriculariae TaxID=2777116 RepID=A0A8S1HES1_9PELO|nr:unnamed protein product [Caenorhabditis auriculariae]